ncbi:MAG: hypothetical protein GY717_16470 [Rhodobacteraceae bacterium]|nr:hypothetical protein [Paracoccaceae bacterium]
MRLSEYKLPDIELLETSHSRALTATNRLFAFSDTKWTDFLLPDALRQLDDEILACALNLRRVLEQKKGRDLSPIVPHFNKFSGRPSTDYDADLWRVLGRIVHHEVLEPTIIKDAEFFGTPESGLIPGFQITDILVTSDRGQSRVDIAGLAFASANELGKSYKQMKSGDAKHGRTRRRKH